MQPVNIICMKYFTRYGPHYVNRLYHGVKRHLSRPFRFVCFTDDLTGVEQSIETFPLPPLKIPANNYPSIWLKFAFFKDGLADLKGPTLFLDLDLIITDSIDCFFDYEPGRICIIHNWIEFYKTIFRARPHIGNSSAYRFEAGKSQFIMDAFEANAEYALKNFPTDQAYMTHVWGDKGVWWPEEWVRSFKRHCMPIFPLNLMVTPRFPPRARIVVFHGKPDPDEAIVGYRSKLHKICRPTPWLSDHWF